MEEAASERLELETDLRRALGRGELTLAYQPVFDLARGGIRSVEALVRWRHPVRGDVSPADFIPAAETSGLVLELGAWVLDAACAQWRSWLDAGAGWARLGLGVNLSARQLHDPRLIGNLRGALLSSGMAPAALTLELPERALVADPAGARTRLQALRAAGVRITIDDFGSGPSALGSLRDFPVDALKLDRAFLHGLRSGTREATLAAAFVAMGHALGSGDRRRGRGARRAARGAARDGLRPGSGLSARRAARSRGSGDPAGELATGRRLTSPYS